MDHLTTATVAAPVGHPGTEAILATWKRIRPFARGLFQSDPDAAYWCCAIMPSVAAFNPNEAPEISKQICFRLVKRDGIRIIEGDGIMVEAWS